jgi:anhydro-N-acetylmuramic acid kinase
MDAWVRRNLAHAFDENGDWGASGEVINALLDTFLQDDYFQSPPPKSTGFEYFNNKWLERFAIEDYAAADVQATLCELTAVTIRRAIRAHCRDVDEVFICGGGVRNLELMRRLDRNLPETSVMSTAAMGLDPDWVEAVAFAWLAMRTINGQTGNLPSVTGASHKVVLGDIHSPYV